MAKIRDANRKEDSASKDDRNAPDEENADLLYYVRKSRERRESNRTPKVTDLSANIGGGSSPMYETTNNKRRKAESIVRTIFVTLVVLAFLTVAVFALRISVFSKKENVDRIPGLTDDKNSKETNMVIIEVTERSLTSVEIDAAIEKDDLALARASAGFGGIQELSLIHGKRQRKLRNSV